MTEIGEYRYDHWTLATKFDWLQAGSGPAGAHEGAFALTECARVLSESDPTLRVQLAKLGVDWQGRAASRAADALECYADDVVDAASMSEAGAARTDDYGGSFANLKSKVPAPIPEGENSFGGMLLDGFRAAQDWAGEHLSTGRSISPAVLVDVQSDYQRRVDANAAADQAVNEAFKAHEQATRAALHAIPEPPPPPPTAVEAGVPGDRGLVGVGGGGAVPGTTGGPAAGRAGGVGPGGSGPGGGPVPDGGSVAGAGPGHAMPGSAVSGGGPGPAAAGGGDVAAAGTGSAGAGAGLPGVPTPPGPAPAGVPTQPGPVPSAMSPGIGPLPSTIPAYPGAPYGRDTALPGSPGRPGGAPRSGGPGGVGAFDEPLPQRGGQALAGARGQASGPGSAQGAGHGPTGAAPMGTGVGAGGQGRTHRNQSYLPDDEPFRVEPEDVTPPVLGVAREAAW
jgi:hypothetical protein